MPIKRKSSGRKKKKTIIKKGKHPLRGETIPKKITDSGRGPITSTLDKTQKMDKVFFQNAYKYKGK